MRRRQPGELEVYVWEEQTLFEVLAVVKALRGGPELHANARFRLEVLEWVDRGRRINCRSLGTLRSSAGSRDDAVTLKEKNVKPGSLLRVNILHSEDGDAGFMQEN